MAILLVDKMFTNHNTSFLKQHTLLVRCLLACRHSVMACS